MKYCIIVADGICDFPHVRTKNLTPLQLARTPVMDELAFGGRMGIVDTIPPGFPAESAVGNMSLLGYDPNTYYTGRAAFEALAAEITVSPGDYVFSCDLVSTFEGAMADPRAGRIRTAEARVLLDDLNDNCKNQTARFHLCDAYHHLLTIKGTDLQEVETESPQKIVGKPLKEHYPRGEGSQALTEIIEQAYELLKNHEINKIRRELGENPADAIWLWGGGDIPAIPSFADVFGLKGGIISAYPEIVGLGKAIGMEIIQVPGATGSWDTDYAAKAKMALSALDSLDLVYLHLGAPMAVSRYGQVTQKVRVIEQIDSKVVSPVYKGLPAQCRLMVSGGHFVSIKEKTGSPLPVPFVIWGKDVAGGTALKFCEKDAAGVNFSISPGHELIKFMTSL